MTSLATLHETSGRRYSTPSFLGLLHLLYLSLFLSRCLRVVRILFSENVSSDSKRQSTADPPLLPFLPAFYFTTLGANCRRIGRAARAALRAARLQAMNYYCLVPHAASRYAGSLSLEGPASKSPNSEK